MADVDAESQYSTPPRSCESSEMAKLRAEVNELRREIEYLRIIVSKDTRRENFGKKTFKVPIEIKLPIFRDENRDSPSEFIRNFDQYCVIKEVPEDFIPILLESALKERASLWFQVAKNEIFDFDGFKSAFWEEFFSVEVRTRAKDSWRNRVFSSSEGPMLSFFYRQTNEVGHIDPNLNEYEKNYIITKQLPTDVQIGLSGIDLNDTKKLTYAISRMDDTRRLDRRNDKEWYREGEKNNWGKSKYDGIKTSEEVRKGDNGRNWNSFKEKHHTFRQANEIPNRESGREVSWRERKDYPAYTQRPFQNQREDNYPQNSNRNTNINSQKESYSDRSNQNKSANTKRVAPVNFHKESENERQNRNTGNRTPGYDAITVEAAIHSLNE